MRHECNTAIVIALASLLAGPAASQELVPLRTQDSTQFASSATVLESIQGEGVLGKEVRSKTDERIGRIVDVIVDPAGRTRAAVIDFGGFLGVGSRKIAIDWDALNFASASDKREFVTMELTRDQIKAAPEYKERRAVTVLGAAGPLLTAPYH